MTQQGRYERTPSSRISLSPRNMVWCGALVIGISLNSVAGQWESYLVPKNPPAGEIPPFNRNDRPHAFQPPART